MLIYWSKKAKSEKDQISSDSERTTSSVPNEQNASFNMNDLSFQNDMKVSSFISTNDYDSVIYDFISKESTNGDSLRRNCISKMKFKKLHHVKNVKLKRCLCKGIH